MSEYKYRSGDLKPEVIKPSQTCPFCDGLGEVMMTKWNRPHEDAPIGGTMKCPHCAGTGIKPLSSEEQRELLERLRRER